MPRQRSKTKVRFGGFIDRRLHRQIVLCAALEGMGDNKFGFMQVLMREGLKELKRRRLKAPRWQRREVPQTPRKADREEADR